MNEELQPSLNAPEIAVKFARSYEGETKAFEELVSDLDAEYVFQHILTNAIFAASGGSDKSNEPPSAAQIELAAYYLYPNFAKGKSRDPEKIGRVFSSLASLQLSRGLAVAAESIDDDPDILGLKMQLLLNAEMIRGSSYPQIIKKRIEGLLFPHDGWFETVVGVGPKMAIQISDACVDCVNANVAKSRERLRDLMKNGAELRQSLGIAKKKKTDTQELHQRMEKSKNELASFWEIESVLIGATFDQICAAIPNMTEKQWLSFRDLVGLTPESRKNITQPREIAERPVFCFSDNRILFLNLACVYDALFEIYDSVTRDPKHRTYRDRNYIQILSGWTEGETTNYLKRVFPQESVFSGLVYPDPDRPLGSEAELDCAVLWGPFLILCEIKGKQFRKRSRLADICRLKQDLKDSIEESFDQASRAIRYIKANGTSEFKEKASGRQLSIKAADLKRIFPMSVTLHEFAGLATQLALLKKIGLFNNSSYPWGVSIANLDIITLFIKHPDIFLHYIQRRLDLQRSDKNIHGDELDLFGHYLDTRLHPSIFWDRPTPDGKPVTMLQLTGATEGFDDWFRAQADPSQLAPVIALKLPLNIERIFESLRSRTDIDSRWIAFGLLDLSPETLNEISSSIDNLRSNLKKSGKIIRTTITADKYSIVILVGMNAPIHILEQHTLFRNKLEKHRLKAEFGIAFGIDKLLSNSPVQFLSFLDDPWSPDAELDEIIAREKPKLLPGQKLPGRNEKCFCKSGKKFKNCCLDTARFAMG